MTDENIKFAVFEILVDDNMIVVGSDDDPYYNWCVPLTEFTKVEIEVLKKFEAVVRSLRTTGE